MLDFGLAKAFAGDEADESVELRPSILVLVSNWQAVAIQLLKWRIQNGAMLLEKVNRRNVTGGSSVASAPPCPRVSTTVTENGVVC